MIASFHCQLIATPAVRQRDLEQSELFLTESHTVRRGDWCVSAWRAGRCDTKRSLGLGMSCASEVSNVSNMACDLYVRRIPSTRRAFVGRPCASTGCRIRLPTQSSACCSSMHSLRCAAARSTLESRPCLCWLGSIIARAEACATIADAGASSAAFGRRHRAL